MNARSTYRYLVHLAVWMALVTLYIFPVLKANWHSAAGLKWGVVRYILYGFINFHLFYYLVFVALPLYGGRKLLRAAAAVITGIVAFDLVKYGVACIFPEQALLRAIPLVALPKKAGAPPVLPKPHYMGFWTYQQIALQTSLAVAVAAFGYFIYLRWRVSDRRHSALALAARNADLQYRRMQFSSQLLLRYLRALQQVLAVPEKRDTEGVSAILQLSELLRYMLYDKSVLQPQALLERELHYYRLYLHLHNRLCPRQPVTLQVQGEPGQLSVAPLLLQSATEQLLQQRQQQPVALLLHIQRNTLHLGFLPEGPAGSHSARRPAWWLLPRLGAVRTFKTPLYPRS